MLYCPFTKGKNNGTPTVRLTSIDHPKIEGAYISGLRARNFNFLVRVQSSSE